MKNLTISERGEQAKRASITLSACSSELRNNALKAIAENLFEKRSQIFEANQKDMDKSIQADLALPLLKRLKFDAHKLDLAIDGINSLIGLPDPLNTTLMAKELDQSLDLYKVACPIGVIGVIFESRPDAFVQISTLCLKSGNAILLKGGHEASETNKILFDLISAATQKVGLPQYWIQNLESREEVNALLKLDQYIDLLIPRGSNAFVRFIMDHSTIPVMGHAEGICHVYIDATADIDNALSIAIDSKAQYPAACNAAETLLVHQDCAKTFLPLFFEKAKENAIHIKGDAATRAIIPVELATTEDWKTEYLDLILSIKIVDSIEEAIIHINTFGSGHTDCIVTENTENAKTFTTLVDSAGVYVNASTRFADGYRYGFGAEVGISTSKLHARGPVGLEGLLSYKYKLIGQGHIVSDYSEGRKTFKHISLDNNCPL